MQNDSDFLDVTLGIYSKHNKQYSKSCTRSWANSQNQRAVSWQRQSLVSHHIGLGSIPDQSMVDVWWTSLGRDSF